MFLADAGILYAAAFVATILATVLGTVIMGVWARMASCCCPGYGFNAYFAYGLVMGQNFSWHQALAAVFVASVLFCCFHSAVCVAG